MAFYEKYKKQKNKKLVVVLSGAGISAESGIKTFRDSNGLWENHDIMEVASIQGWNKNPELVLDFYNQRRKQAAEVKPNAGHLALVELEKDFEVVIITQNVDALHERAGSTQVLHLHGELSKVRSSEDEYLIYDIGGEPIKMGDKCEKGSQLRPHIVWFGEEVPLFQTACYIAEQADYFICVGTSLVVYPAAQIIHFAPKNCPKYLVDPNYKDNIVPNLTIFNENATKGLPKVVELIKIT